MWYVCYNVLPPANEVCEGYVLHVSVCPWGGGLVSQNALHVSRGVSRSTPGVGGFPGPHLGWGGFQVHTWGVSRGVSRSTPGGSPGPQPGGGSPGPHPGGGSAGTHLGEGVSQHALRQTPPCGRLLPRAVCILLECILFFKDSLLDS